MLFPPGQPVNEKMPLWRYMKLSSFFMLLEGRAFFPSAARLRSGDPLEGDLLPEPEELMSVLQDECGGDASNLVYWLKNHSNDIQKMMLDANPNDAILGSSIFSSCYIEELAKRRAVWCWFNASHESAGMWSVYGNAGIAIRTSFSGLKASLPSDVPFQIAKIMYADRAAGGQLSLVGNDRHLFHRPHLIKGREYAHENEIRVTTRCLPDESGRMVENINALTLIEEVVLSPLFPIGEAKAVQSQIEKFPWGSSKPDIRRSSILGRIAVIEENNARFTGIFKGPTVEEAEPGLPSPLNKL